jgi:hypothetical protein
MIGFAARQVPPELPSLCAALIFPQSDSEIMSKLIQILLLLLLVVVVAGLATLALWNPDPPTAPIERIIPNDQLGR